MPAMKLNPNRKDFERKYAKLARMGTLLIEEQNLEKMGFPKRTRVVLSGELIRIPRIEFQNFWKKGRS